VQPRLYLDSRQVSIVHLPFEIHQALHTQRFTAGTHVVNASRIGPNNSSACGKRRPLHQMRRLSRRMILAAVLKLTSRRDQSSHVLFSPAPNPRNYMIASQLGRWLDYVPTPYLHSCVWKRGVQERDLGYLSATQPAKAHHGHALSQHTHTHYTRG
jgi:hypothetical protein